MRIVQALDALDFGDGVCTDVINLAGLFTELGVENRICSRYAHPSVAHLRQGLGETELREDDLLLYHYYGKSDILPWALEQKGQKILCYHNITPPAFFAEYDAATYMYCLEGLRDLREHAHKFEGYAADSSYNRDGLASLGIQRERISVLPICIDFLHLGEPYDKSLHARISDLAIVLCVGRIAPNKRIEDVLELFDCYWRNWNPDAWMVFAGNDAFFPKYTGMVLNKARSLASRQRIVFTGKIESSQLNTLYRAASFLVCMSEHEGFCLPLLEGMKFRIPVMAYDAGAIAETMGGAGILAREKNYPELARLMHAVLEDGAIREKIVQKQLARIRQLDRAHMRSKVQNFLARWRN